tara:strand:- start:1623 stop:2072 length:450 start_codon:yes stop_codon:yes gene_type:complete
MSAYDGIEEVRATRSRSQEETVWIGPGRYELEVVRVADGRADQGEGRPYFVVEFDVLESTNPEIPKGETVSWMTMRGKFKQYFLQDVQNFIAAATGSNASEVTSEVVSTCTSDEQPLVGTVVQASAYNKPSQSSGKDFTVVSYKTRRDN